MAVNTGNNRSSTSAVARKTKTCGIWQPLFGGLRVLGFHLDVNVTAEQVQYHIYIRVAFQRLLVYHNKACAVT